MERAMTNPAVPPELLQELVNRTADGAYIVDENQRIIAWNKSAEQLIGFRAADVIGMPCHQIVGGQTADGCVACRKGCMPHTATQQGELVPSFDIKVRTASGHLRWVSVSIVGMSVDYGDADPSIVVIHMFRDIEARKRAETFATEVAVRARQLSVSPSGTGDDYREPRLSTSLSPRELEVLALMAQGLDTDAIASSLVIGRSTVRNHIQRILHKLEVHTRLEAVLYANEHHLFD
jgi:PAS domain S-box-containing protein